MRLNILVLCRYKRYLHWKPLSVATLDSVMYQNFEYLIFISNSFLPWKVSIKLLIVLIMHIILYLFCTSCIFYFLLLVYQHYLFFISLHHEFILKKENCLWKNLSCAAGFMRLYAKMFHPIIFRRSYIKNLGNQNKSFHSFLFSAIINSEASSGMVDKEGLLNCSKTC